MRLKHVVVVSIVGVFGLLTAACSDDAKDACEKMNEKCGMKLDCQKVSDDHDKKSDTEKEKDEKVIDCINDADTCEQITKCNGGDNEDG